MMILARRLQVVSHGCRLPINLAYSWSSRSKPPIGRTKSEVVPKYWTTGLDRICVQLGLEFSPCNQRNDSWQSADKLMVRL